MSTDSAQTTVPLTWSGNSDSEPIEVFVRTSVDLNVPIGWYRPGVNASSIVILIGDEQVSLEFFDEESLRRISAVATAAIPQLRQAIAERERGNDEFERTWRAEKAADAAVRAAQTRHASRS